MDGSEASGAQAGRLQRLTGFLQQDPENLRLLADTASAALDEEETGVAAGLLARYERLEPLPPNLLNLRGLIALRTQRFDDAEADFAALLEAGHDAPPVRFNLAWAKAMRGGYQAALDLLSEEVVALGPRAARLRVEMLHHLGQLEEALEAGGRYAELYPDDQALAGALATVAIDAEDVEVARYYADRGAASPDGLAALGVLLLNENRLEQSMALFDRALEANARSPRALLGKGLAMVAAGDAQGAAPLLESGAEIFGDHPGSWLAAGWARYLAGDVPGSRTQFERALAADDTFAESHGALAVVDLAQGDTAAAARRTEVALRLDRNCFSAALAKSMLLEQGGDARGAEAIRRRAMNLPAGVGGQTIAQAIVALGTARR